MEDGALAIASPTTRPEAGDTKAIQQLEEPDVAARLQKLARRQLNRLVALEPKVLRDESSKPVHDLRVASRRLQSLLDVLYPSPRPAEIRKLRRRLKRARTALGDLRNHDVLGTRIDRMLGRKRLTHRRAWEAARDHVLKLRRKQVARAHRKLARLNLAVVYLRVRKQLREAADKNGPPSPSPPSLAQFPSGEPAAWEQSLASLGSVDLGARFAERLDELWRDFEARAAEARHDPDALHPLRLGTKRLRYLAEVADELDVPGSGPALRWLRALQSKLGDWHDVEVLGGTLIDMVADRKFLEENLQLAIEVEKLALGLRTSMTRSCEHYLREAFTSQAYHETVEWVSQFAASRPLSTG